MIKISQKTYTNNNGIPWKKANKDSPQLNKLQLINFKGTMSRSAHVRDLRSTSWSNELSAILDLRKIRRFLRFFVRLAPLEVVFSQFTIHPSGPSGVRITATRELESSVTVSSFDVVEVTCKNLWIVRSIFFMVQTRIIVFAFLSFRKIGSLVRVEALAQQNESTTQTEVVPVKQKA